MLQPKLINESVKADTADCLIYGIEHISDSDGKRFLIIYIYGGRHYLGIYNKTEKKAINYKYIRFSTNKLNIKLFSANNVNLFLFTE